MAEIKDVSGTAFVVAEFRAEENRAVTPLYRDPVVGLFLSDESRHAAGLVGASFPPVKDMVKIRTRYFDDVLEEQLSAQFRQVVILGAGLDTRAVRKQAAGVAYFEIDDAATLDLKRTCYAPTYFIWEGNTMYLPLDSVRHILTELRRHVRRFRLSFDYMAEAVISKTTGDAGVTRLVESFAAMGAPWLSGIRDIQNLAREARLNLVEHFTTSQLGQTYGLGRPVRSPIFDFYQCVLLAASGNPAAAGTFGGAGSPGTERHHIGRASHSLEEIGYSCASMRSAGNANADANPSLAAGRSYM